MNKTANWNRDTWEFVIPVEIIRIHGRTAEISFKDMDSEDILTRIVPLEELSDIK